MDLFLDFRGFFSVFWVQYLFNLFLFEIRLRLIFQKEFQKGIIWKQRQQLVRSGISEIEIFICFQVLLGQFLCYSDLREFLYQCFCLSQICLEFLGLVFKVCQGFVWKQKQKFFVEGIVGWSFTVFCGNRFQYLLDLNGLLGVIIIMLDLFMGLGL